MTDAPTPDKQPRKSGGARGPLASVTAVLLSAVLGLAVAGKLMGPDENKAFFETGILLDHVVAGAEIVMILLMLALHRTKLIWPVVTVMFAGFFGYATYWTVSEGKPCGCFGELWEPPLGVSMGIDAVAVIAGLAFTWAYGGRAVLLSLALVASLGAGWVGYDYAYDHSPEKALDDNDGVPTPVRFLATDMMAFASDAPADELAPSHLVFVYEVGCETCEQYKGDMELFGTALDARQDEYLRIHQYSVDEVADQTGIQPWEWPAGSPPVVFIVQYGEIIPLPSMPDETQPWFTGDATPFDIVQLAYEYMGGDWFILEEEAYAQ